MNRLETAISAHAAESRRAELRDLLRAFRAPAAAAFVVTAVGFLLPRIVREAFLLLSLGIIGKIWIPTMIHWWIFYRKPNETSRPLDRRARATIPSSSD